MGDVGYVVMIKFGDGERDRPPKKSPQSIKLPRFHRLRGSDIAHVDNIRSWAYPACGGSDSIGAVSSALNQSDSAAGTTDRESSDTRVTAQTLQKRNPDRD